MTTSAQALSIENAKMPRDVVMGRVEGICAQHRVTIAQLKGRSRQVRFVTARRAVVRMLDGEYGWSQARIGRFLSRCPSSICYLLGHTEKAQRATPWRVFQQRKAAS